MTQLEMHRLSKRPFPVGRIGERGPGNKRYIKENGQKRNWEVGAHTLGETVRGEVEGKLK